MKLPASKRALTSNGLAGSIAIIFAFVLEEMGIVLPDVVLSAIVVVIAWIGMKLGGNNNVQTNPNAGNSGGAGNGADRVSGNRDAGRN